MERKIRPPKARTAYRPAKHGTRSAGMPGNYYFKPGAKIDFMQPKLEKGPLWLRPIAQLKAEDPSQFDPPRYSLEEDDVTDWWRKMPVVTYAGCEGRTVHFVTHNPVWEERCGYDPWRQNPYHVAYRTLKKAKNSSDRSIQRKWKTEWNPLIANDSDYKAQIWSRPQDRFFYQGFVYEAEGEVFAVKHPRGAGPNDRIPVVEVSSGAGNAAARMFEHRNPEWDGSDPEDYNGAFFYGDPTSPEHGRFLVFYDPDKIAFNTWSSLSDGFSSTVNPQFTRAKEVAIRRTYKLRGQKISARLSEDMLNLALARAQWWDDVFAVPPYTEDCDPMADIERYHHQIAIWMANAFKPVREMLLFGWRDVSDFAAYDEVQTILELRRSVAVQGRRQSAAPVDDDDLPPTQSHDPVPYDDEDDEDYVDQGAQAYDDDDEDLPEAPRYSADEDEYQEMLASAQDEVPPWEQDSEDEDGDGDATDDEDDFEVGDDSTPDDAESMDALAARKAQIEAGLARAAVESREKAQASARERAALRNQDAS